MMKMGHASVATDLSHGETAPLSWAQICERYPRAWVCLVEIDRQAPSGGAIRAARVVSHSTTRKESVAAARALWAQYPEIGHFFTGSIELHSPLPRIVMTDEIRDLVRIPR
jgi:hypothetical protein